MSAFAGLGGFAAGAIMGFIVGYALRKILGVILVSIGMFIIGLALLVHSGIAVVDFAALQQLLYGLFIFGLQTGNQVVDKAISGWPFTLGLICGLGLGLFKSAGVSFRPKILELEGEKRRRVLRRAQGD
ncbi:MAG: FUN14 domain-containing protein [Nitrososphaerota archaeon]